MKDTFIPLELIQSLTRMHKPRKFSDFSNVFGILRLGSHRARARARARAAKAVKNLSKKEKKKRPASDTRAQVSSQHKRPKAHIRHHRLYPWSLCHTPPPPPPLPPHLHLHLPPPRAVVNRPLHLPRRLLPPYRRQSVDLGLHYKGVS